MLPRLIATDLDGTLLSPTGELTPRTVAALHAIADAGVLVVFASGRPPFIAQREITAAGRGVHYGVMANGTIVCRLPDGEELRTVSFGADLARRAVITLRAHDPAFGFALATDRGFSAEAGFHERMPIDPGGTSVPDALVGHEDATLAIKLIAFHPHRTAHELLVELPAVLGDDLTVAHMGADAVEIAPAGADKGIGLHWLCEHLGIAPAEVMVFGDEVNDLPMFRWAGRRVAVGNAHPTVKDAADEVTGTNAEDGVAQVLERLLARSGQGYGGRMERPAIARFTHVALPCTDIDATIAWYERFTPLRLLDRREDADGFGAWLGQPDMVDKPFIIVLVSFHRDRPAGPHPTLAPFAHLGIEVPRKDDVDEIAARGRAEGCLAWEPQQWPYPVGYVCALTDPDGNMVEFSFDQGVYAKVAEVWGEAAQRDTVAEVWGPAGD